MRNPQDNMIGKIIKAIAGITGIAGLAAITSKTIKKTKAKRKENAKTECGVKAICDNSSVRCFVNDFTEAMTKDFENLDASMKERELLRTLYENEIDSIGILNEIEIRPAPASVSGKQTGTAWPKALSIISSAASLSVCIFSAFCIALSKPIGGRESGIIIIASLAGFIASAASFLSLRAKDKEEKSKQVSIPFDIVLSRDECERRFGKDFKGILDRIHSEREKLANSMEGVSLDAEEELRSSVSETYCELYEAAARDNIRNVRKNALPSMRIMLRNGLGMEIIDEFTDENRNLFEIRDAECAESYVLQPAIISTASNATIRRGTYMRKITPTDS